MARRPITSPELEAAFPIGSQVRYSQRGKDSLQPRDPARTGIVEGYAYGGPRHGVVCAVRVRWDGCKQSWDPIHRDYLELA